MSEQSLHSLRNAFLWLVAGFCCFATVACGGSTVNIYDKAQVLDTLKVHNTASNLFKNINIYTFNDFYATQADFYNAVVDKMRAGPNLILLVIDTVHPSAYILRGAGVNLSRSDITQATNAFKETYEKRGGYTQSTVAALNALNTALNVNHGLSWLPILWAIPFVLIGGAFLLFLVLRARHKRQMQRAR